MKIKIIRDTKGIPTNFKIVEEQFKAGLYTFISYNRLAKIIEDSGVLAPYERIISLDISKSTQGIDIELETKDN